MLWLMTVNSLNQMPSISAPELAIDPLAVLRCDSRVFRTGPILHILLYMLKACLAASRTSLSQYCADQNLMNPTIQESEREELKNSLVLTQESAAIQILLEICQETQEELNLRSRLTDVQETQSAVCCYLHQAFIEDTTMTLAKLVHFQVNISRCSISKIENCLSGLPSSTTSCDHGRSAQHVHMSGHVTRTVVTTQHRQAGVRCGSHLPPVHYGRHAQESLLRQVGRQLAPHAAGCAGRQRQTEAD